MAAARDSSSAGPVATIAGLPLKTHDHLCVLYRGEPQRDELMVDFFAEGLAAGHKVYCMIAASERARIGTSVRQRLQPGADMPEDAADVGELEFTEPSGSHLETGGFVSERMLEFWESWGDRTYEHHHHAFARIGVDMSWAQPFVAPDFISDLARYESRFNVWASHYPLVTACLYDLDKFGGDVVIPIIRVHPKVWMNGVVVDNPYFLDSEYLLTEEVGELARAANR